MAKSAVKFRDTVAAYDRIAGEIRAGRFAPVLVELPLDRLRLHCDRQGSVGHGIE